MANRLIPQEMLNEDWFIDLPSDHKLLLLWAWIHAGQEGIWRPKIAYFRQSMLNGKMVFVDQFIEKINEGCDEGRERIKVLPTKNWIILGWQTGKSYLVEQLGPVFKPGFGSHKGALKNLIINKVHPSEILGFDWLGMERLDFKQLTFLANHSVIHREDISEMLRTIPQKERNEEIGNRIEEIGNRIIKKEPTITTTTSEKVFQKKFPVLEDVKRVFRNQGGTDEMAEKFFADNSAAEWLDRKGRPIPQFSYLVPSFIANWNKVDENQKNNKHGKVDRTGARPGLVRDKP